MKRRLLLFFLAATTAACELPLNGTGPDGPPDAGRSSAQAQDDAGDDAPPSNSDLPPTVTVCHSPVGVPGAGVTDAVCPHGLGDSDNAVLNEHAAAYVTATSDGCIVHAVPIECSMCDYTCDCLLRYLASPGGGCACSQAAVGGTLVLSGGGCQ